MSSATAIYRLAILHLFRCPVVREACHSSSFLVPSGERGLSLVPSGESVAASHQGFLI